MPASKKSQKEKFDEAARKLETNDSEERFDRMLKKTAKDPAKPVGEKRKE